jgi:precorrin-8X/cobalt-precorrin-8 methylmutase
MIEYLRDPKAIYARSFSIIQAEADFSHLPRDCEAMATRIVHACGMPEIAADLRISSDFCGAAKTVIRTGREILVDAEMVRHGIIDKTLTVICTLNDASANGTTRSAAAVELWRPHLEGALVVIGNAPTALFALLDLIDAGSPRPAAVVGFPVGFVGAAESKAELHRNPRGIPYATLLGRKGGSAMAAAVINALTQNAA